MNVRSGFSFWLIKNGLPYSYPKLEYSIKTDVAILGGGISGALAGYHLVNAGVDCVLADARTLGLGSSCASTSLLQYEIDTPLCELVEKVGARNAARSYKLCSEAIYKLGAIAKNIKFKDFQFKKSLYYAAHKKDSDFIKREFAIREKNGFKVSYLSEGELIYEYGFASAGAILSDEGAQTDAYSFMHALHQHAIKNGMKVFDRTRVSEIRHSKNGITLRTENGAEIKTKKLIYATGYEAVDFIDKKIVDLKSTFATASEQFNEDVEFWKGNCLIWNTADPYLYIRTTNDKRIIVGGRDEDFYDPLKRDKLIKKKTSQLVKDFNKIFPHIEFKHEFNWAGTFGSTKDGLPFIGTYREKPNSFFSLGFGGNGITFSLIAAEIITDLILGKKNPEADIFSFERL